MAFGMKKKPDISLEKLAQKILEIEQRLNNLAEIMQEDCPAIKRYLDKQPEQALPIKQEILVQQTAREEEIEDIKKIISGQPSKRAKQILRI